MVTDHTEHLNAFCVCWDRLASTPAALPSIVPALVAESHNPASIGYVAPAPISLANVPCSMDNHFTTIDVVKSSCAGVRLRAVQKFCYHDTSSFHLASQEQKAPAAPAVLSHEARIAIMRRFTAAPQKSLYPLHRHQHQHQQSTMSAALVTHSCYIVRKGARPDTARHLASCQPLCRPFSALRAASTGRRRINRRQRECAAFMNPFQQAWGSVGSMGAQVAHPAAHADLRCMCTHTLISALCALRRRSARSTNQTVAQVALQLIFAQAYSLKVRRTCCLTGHCRSMHGHGDTAPRHPSLATLSLRGRSICTNKGPCSDSTTTHNVSSCRMPTGLGGAAVCVLHHPLRGLPVVPHQIQKDPAAGPGRVLLPAGVCVRHHPRRHLWCA